MRFNFHATDSEIIGCWSIFLRHPEPARFFDEILVWQEQYPGWEHPDYESSWKLNGIPEGKTTHYPPKT